ncbi:MAG: hypothetical protein ACI88H_001372 [Cocleimonas sp.]|jgi:hypothetical protein
MTKVPENTPVKTPVKTPVNTPKTDPIIPNKKRSNGTNSGGPGKEK